MACALVEQCHVNRTPSLGAAAPLSVLVYLPVSYINSCRLHSRRVPASAALIQSTVRFHSGPRHLGQFWLHMLPLCPACLPVSLLACKSMPGAYCTVHEKMALAKVKPGTSAQGPAGRYSLHYCMQREAKMQALHAAHRPRRIFTPPPPERAPSPAAHRVSGL